MSTVLWPSNGLLCLSQSLFVRSSADAWDENIWSTKPCTMPLTYQPVSDACLCTSGWSGGVAVHQEPASLPADCQAVDRCVHAETHQAYARLAARLVGSLIGGFHCMVCRLDCSTVLILAAFSKPEKPFRKGTIDQVHSMFWGCKEASQFIA